MMKKIYLYIFAFLLLSTSIYGQKNPYKDFDGFPVCWENGDEKVQLYARYIEVEGRPNEVNTALIQFSPITQQVERITPFVGMILKPGFCSEDIGSVTVEVDEALATCDSCLIEFLKSDTLQVNFDPIFEYLDTTKLELEDCADWEALPLQLCEKSEGILIFERLPHINTCEVSIELTNFALLDPSNPYEDIFIDWGDGTIDPVTTTIGNTYTHSYCGLPDGTYQIQVVALLTDGNVYVERLDEILTSDLLQTVTNQDVITLDAKVFLERRSNYYEIICKDGTKLGYFHADTNSGSGFISGSLPQQFVFCQNNPRNNVYVPSQNASIFGIDDQTESRDTIVQSVCKKSKSLYTVIDNTKTRFSWTMDMRVYFTDGSSYVITQTPTAGWTQQINQWAVIFDAVVAAKCNAYIVEARCNLLPNGCGGLSPPPSEIVGTIPSMFARYLQITACSTCPAINNVEIISINGNNLDKARPLVMEYVEGQEIRYDLCQSCGTEGTLYYAGTDQVVEEQDMPQCLFDCTEDFPSTPEPVCAFESNDEGCDDMGTEDDADDTPVTRICDICEGEINCSFFITDTDGALIDYNDGNGLIGGFVNCESKDTIFDPVPECEDYEYLPVDVCFEVDHTIRYTKLAHVNTCDITIESTIVSSTAGIQNVTIDWGDGSIDNIADGQGITTTHSFCDLPDGDYPIQVVLDIVDGSRYVYRYDITVLNGTVLTFGQDQSLTNIFKAYIPRLESYYEVLCDGDPIGFFRADDNGANGFFTSLTNFGTLCYGSSNYDIYVPSENATLINNDSACDTCLYDLFNDLIDSISCYAGSGVSGECLFRGGVHKLGIIENITDANGTIPLPNYNYNPSTQEASLEADLSAYYGTAIDVQVFFNSSSWGHIDIVGAPVEIVSYNTTGSASDIPFYQACNVPGIASYNVSNILGTSFGDGCGWWNVNGVDQFAGTATNCAEGTFNTAQDVANYFNANDPNGNTWTVAGNIVSATVSNTANYGSLGDKDSFTEPPNSVEVTYQNEEAGNPSTVTGLRTITNIDVDCQEPIPTVTTFNESLIKECEETCDTVLTGGRCELQSGNFDPDRGSRWDEFNWNGSAYVIETSPGQTAGGWIQGMGTTDNQCVDESDFVVAHIARYNSGPGTGATEQAEGWILIAKNQLSTDGNGSVVYDPSIAPTFGACTNAEIIAEIESNGLPNNIATDLVDGIVPANLFITSGIFYTNGDFNGGSLPAPFGQCFGNTQVGAEEEIICTEGGKSLKVNIDVACQDPIPVTDSQIFSLLDTGTLKVKLEKFPLNAPLCAYSSTDSSYITTVNAIQVFENGGVTNTVYYDFFNNPISLTSAFFLVNCDIGATFGGSQQDTGIVRIHQDPNMPLYTCDTCVVEALKDTLQVEEVNPQSQRVTGRCFLFNDTLEVISFSDVLNGIVINSGYLDAQTMMDITELIQPSCTDDVSITVVEDNTCEYKVTVVNPTSGEQTLDLRTTDSCTYRLYGLMTITDCSDNIVFQGEKVMFANIKYYTTASLSEVQRLQDGGYMENLNLFTNGTPSSIQIPLAPTTATLSGCAGTTTSAALIYNSANPTAWRQAVGIALENYLCTFGFVSGSNYEYFVANTGAFTFRAKNNPDQTWLGLDRTQSAFAGQINTSGNGVSNISYGFFSTSQPIAAGEIVCNQLMRYRANPISAFSYIDVDQATFNNLSINSYDVSFSNSPLVDTSYICPSFILTANPLNCNGTATYLWSTGDTTQTITWDGTGVQPTVSINCICELNLKPCDSGGSSDSCDLCEVNQNMFQQDSTFYDDLYYKICELIAGQDSLINLSQPDCEVTNDNETHELTGTDGLIFIAETFWSLSYTVLSGSVTEETNQGPINNIPTGYTGTHTARGECEYLDNRITLTGESANTRVIIRVIR